MVSDALSPGGANYQAPSAGGGASSPAPSDGDTSCRECVERRWASPRVGGCEARCDAGRRRWGSGEAPEGRGVGEPAPWVMRRVDSKATAEPMRCGGEAAAGRWRGGGEAVARRRRGGGATVARWRDGDGGGDGGGESAARRWRGGGGRSRVVVAIEINRGSAREAGKRSGVDAELAIHRCLEQRRAYLLPLRQDEGPVLP